MMGSLLDFDYREVRIDQAIIDNSRQLFFAVMAGSDRIVSSEGTLKRLKSVDRAAT
jgi:hypothetical protein